MSEKLKGQVSARKDLETAIEWFRRKYGSDLPAFFRDSLKRGEDAGIQLAVPQAVSATTNKAVVAGGGG